MADPELLSVLTDMVGIKLPGMESLSEVRTELTAENNTVPNGVYINDIGQTVIVSDSTIKPNRGLTPVNPDNK